MKLRTRLVLAFFALSVVPLGAVTFYSYRNNVRALRDAAERETDLLAGELGQRMQLVTAQLSQRVEHLMDIAELQAAADEAKQLAQARPVATEPVVTRPAVMADSLLGDSIAKSLGEAAMLLNNVELQNMQGGRGGGPPRAPRPPLTVVTRTNPTVGVGARVGGGGANTTGQSGTATGATGSTTAVVPPPPPGAPAPRDARQARDGRGDASRTQFELRGRRGGSPPDPAGATAAGQGASRSAPAPGAPPVPPEPQAQPGSPRVGAVPGIQGVLPVSGTIVQSAVDAEGKLKIDMAPIRREMFRQIVPDGRIENLTPEQRQRIAGEMNQRMMGIAEGIRIGAAEIAKRAQEAEKLAATRAAATGQKASAQTQARSTGPDAGVSDLKRMSSLTGNRIDVKIERDGQVVRQMHAEMNLPNVLATVFSTTKSDRGELPFAVAKDGTLYTRSDVDKPRVASLGDVAKPDGPSMVRLPEWIVVTTQDQSGSGLRLGIARPVSDSMATLRRTAARNAGLGLLFIGLMLVAIVPISTRLTRNLTTLSGAVERIAQGEYHTRVPVRANDEVGQLAVAFNKMAADVERHQKTAVEQERIRRELELGRQIQNEMLPHAPLHLGLTEVTGVSVPAREVGGDFFNYFVLDTGQVALLMGDVSGKGVGAALLMANIQASLRVRMGLGQDLSAVADAIDRDIDENSPGPVYATLFLGVLDPATRLLRYVNAGHNPQYVFHTNGGLRPMHATGLPVGLLSGRGYREQQVQLAPGDQLFFYTDGCVESENEQGEMFGIDRLEPLLIEAAQSPAPIKRIEEGIAAFRGKSEPLDDATLMTVKVG
jgi:serine phosphatase RsbU (regulator of sigma subunit)